MGYFDEQEIDYRSIFDMGRKRAFETNDELKEKIIEYFKDGIETFKEFHNGEPHDIKVFTITGLALFLGFADRRSFYDYIYRGEKEEATNEEKEISHTLKKARGFIENNYEKILQRGNSSGAIFALKNFGWKDIQTIEGELSDNGERKFVIEHRRSKYENLDENGNPIIEDKS